MNKYTLNVHCMQFIKKCQFSAMFINVSIYRYIVDIVLRFIDIVDTLNGVSMTALIMAKICLLFIDTSLKPHIYSCKMLLTLQRLTYIYVKQQQNLISRHYYLCRATSLKKFISWLNNMFVLLCFQRGTCFSYYFIITL